MGKLLPNCYFIIVKVICCLVYLYYRIMEAAPTLPDFALALKPDEYQLPQVDPAWKGENIKGGQTGPTHLKGDNG